jgi:glycosyltransferase involved in cell wall biosynthesis
MSDWHPVVAASVARRHLAQGPAHVAALARRVLPALPLGVASGPGRDRSWPSEAAARETAAGRLRRAARHRAEVDALRPDLRVPSYAAPGPRRDADGPGGPAAVTHLVTTALPEVVAGYTVRTQGIARAQVEAGHRVDVVTRLGFPVTRGHLRAAGRVDVDGVDHHRLLTTVPLHADVALERDVAASRRLVSRLAPDVLHAHSAHPNAQVALVVGARLGLPVVYEVRGFQEETRRSADPRQVTTEHHALTRAAETWCARRADAVVTLAPSMRDELVARGVDADRVHLVPNAVPASWLRVSGHERAAAASLRASTGARPDDLVVVVAGTLNAYEGLDVLIRAIGALGSGADPVGVWLVVVGDGPERARLERLAAGLPVTFVGAVAPGDVRRWLLAADASALPRLDLPVTRLVPPLKPVEAMGLGLPLVSSDLPPLAGLVGDVDGEATGLLVRPGDTDDLARALRRLAADPALRARLGDAGARHVAATRTWTAAAATYSALYDQLTTRSVRTTRTEETIR